MESLDRKIEDARDAVKKDDRNNQGREIEFAEPVKFLSTVSFSELPETPVLNAQAGATSISVLNTQRVKLQNTGSVTVAAITDGQEGQEVSFLGDGFTTIANNSTIATSTGANKLLVANTIYKFTYIGAKWVESSSGSSYTAGAGLALTGTSFSNVYVGKVIPFVSTLRTLTGSAGTFRFSNSLYPRTDTTGMTSIRLSYFSGVSTGTGTWTPSIYYSTNAGGTWTQITFSGIDILDGNGNLYRSAASTLPAGARNAATWFYAAYTETNAAHSVDISSLSVELTP
jgi:hypothetical protein